MNTEDCLGKNPYCVVENEELCQICREITQAVNKLKEKSTTHTIVIEDTTNQGCEDSLWSSCCTVNTS